MSEERTAEKSERESESDEEIIKLYFERSESASALTDKKYGKTLLRQAMNLLGNKEDAEECLNDTYLAAWSNIPPDSPAYLFAYLSSIIRKRCIDVIRKRETQKRRNTQELSDELCDILSGSDAQDELDTNLLRETLDKYLRSADERKRRVFVLRYWYSESVKTIAKREGVSEDAISALLSRTRRELKELLEKEGLM